MVPTARASRRARRFLLLLVLVALAAQTAARPAEVRVPTQPAAESGATNAPAWKSRVILFGGVTDALLAQLQTIAPYSIVYRYPAIAGVAIKVAPEAIDGVIAFAQSRGVKAERDVETKETLASSTQTIHVKGTGNAWDLGYTGAGVTIGVIDSGIKGSHKSLDDLDDNAATNDPKVLKFKDYVNAGGAEVAPYDDNSHGSHVSGIAAGTGDGSSGTGPRGHGSVGVAYNANLAGFKVLGSNGTGAGSDFVAALQWIVTNGSTLTPPIRIATYSAGSIPVGGNNNGNSSQSQMVNAAYNAGIVVTVAGGNGTTDGLLPNSTPGNVNIPADAENAISVCSSDSAIPPTAPTYSDWDSEGPTADGRIKPDVCAPGDSVNSVDARSGRNDTAYFNQGGTSMSTPHVAGVAALIIQAVPAITPAQVKTVLQETAREYNAAAPNKGKNNDRGYGEVFAKEAIQMAITRFGGGPTPLAARANGPYNVVQNNPIVLNASATGGTPAYSFSWDLNDDGVFGDATGPTATFSNTATTGTKTVRVRVTDSAASPATSIDVTTVNVLAPASIFTDNVEGGTNGWVATSDGAVAAPGWHRTTARASSPTNSWYPGQDQSLVYASGQDVSLTRAFNLAAGAAATSGQILLRFKRSGSLEPTFDFLNVRVRRVGDSSWQNLASFDNYTTSAAFTTHTYDITSFKGQNTEVSFQFTSDDFNDVDYATATGPFVDDIELIGTVPVATDTTAPAAITDLAAGSAGQQSIGLTWTATGDDGSTGTATSYDLRRATAPITTANFALATNVSAPAPRAAGQAESLTVTGLAPGTTYYFAVMATDEAGNTSPISNLASATTLPDTTPPSKVVGVTAAAGDRAIALAWSPATDNVAVDHYVVFVDGVATTNASNTAATLTGLTNGQTYALRVAAVDTAHNQGLASDAITATPKAAIGWPQAGGDAGKTGYSTGRGSIATPQILQTLTSADTVTASPVLVDLDGDDKLDVVVVQDMTSPNSAIVVRAFKQGPTALSPLWTSTVPQAPALGQPATEGFARLAAGDLDGNGTTEVVVSSNYITNFQGATLNDGSIRVLRGSNGTLVGSAIPTTIGLKSAPAIGELDGNAGTLEVAYTHQVGGTSSGYYLAVAGFNGSGFSNLVDINVGANSMLASPAIGELRSTPGREIVVAESAGTQRVLICSVAAGCPAADTIGVAQSVRGLSVADLDGDGVNEIVVNSTTGNSLKVVKTTPPMSAAIRADGFLWNNPTVADVDGDGRREIVNVNYSEFVDDTAKAGNISVRGYNGTAITAEGDLARTPTPPESSQSRGGASLVDITGDSRPEMVFGAANGKLVAIGFPTSGNPAALWSLTLPGAANTPVAAGDVTGDGLADLVTVAANSSIVVVGAGPLASIALSPASSSIQAGQSETYTVTGKDAAGNTVGDVTAGSSFAITGASSSCTSNVCTSTQAGSHTVTATYSAKTATAALGVTAGPPANLTLSPATATKKAGEAQTYTATASDQYGNSLGDATASSGFAIAPDGSCSLNACSGSTPGNHTVTGSYGTATGTAALSVTLGDLASIVISPATATIAAGASQSYTAQGYDSLNNSLGDVTPTTTFTISPNGACTLNACTATTAGSHTVTGTNSGKTATAALTVTAAALHHLVLAPSAASVTINHGQAYTAQGRDVYENSLGDVTGATAFSIAPDGSCAGATCTPVSPGQHTVTGTNGTATGTAALNAIDRAIARIDLTPSAATIVAGGSQAFTAQGYDADGAPLGDVTSMLVFSIGPNGSCTSNTCTATVAGPHTVRGTANGVAGIAALTVNAGPAVRLSLMPAAATIPVGGSRTYTANGVDQYGNVTANLTSSTAFAITDGSCTANSCSATTIGRHTVTGASGALSGTATLDVVPQSPTIDSPASNSLNGTTVDIIGHAPSGSTIVLYDNGAKIADNLPVAGDGSWQHSGTFAHGTHTLTAFAKIGTAVSAGSAPRTFRVDAIAPTNTIFKRSGYVLFQVYNPIEPVQVDGIARDTDAGVARVVVTYTDASGDVASTDTLTCTGACTEFRWSSKPSLMPGFYTVRAVAEDRAGNSGAAVSINIVSMSLVSGGGSAAATSAIRHNVVE